MGRPLARRPAQARYGKRNWLGVAVIRATVHGGLLLVVEVADQADELVQAPDVEDVEVDLVAAAGGRKNR